MKNVELSKEAYTCAICTQMYVNPCTLLPCQHTFCESCLRTWEKNNTTCMVCRQTYTTSFVSQILKEHITDYFGDELLDCPRCNKNHAYKEMETCLKKRRVASIDLVGDEPPVVVVSSSSSEYESDWSSSSEEGIEDRPSILFKCILCHQNFCTFRELHDHMVYNQCSRADFCNLDMIHCIQNGYNPYACGCGVSFTDGVSSMNDHYSVCKRDIQCYLCKTSCAYANIRKHVHDDCSWRTYHCFKCDNLVFANAAEHHRLNHCHS